MSRVTRIVLIVLFSLPAAAFIGCGPSKEDATPNQEFKAPNVPPSDRGKDKAGGVEPPKRK